MNHVINHLKTKRLKYDLSHNTAAQQTTAC